MKKPYENKFTWRIKNFSKLQSEIIYSDQFVIGGCKWRLIAYPKGNNNANHFSLFLDVADSEFLPLGWRRQINFRLTIVNQRSQFLSQDRGAQVWFDQKCPSLGYPKMLILTKLHPKIHGKYGGFLVNDELKVVAEVDVLQVVENSDLLEETSCITKTIDINGFQVLSSQVEFVKRLFLKQPNIVSNFRPQNRHLKSAYMNFLLNLIEILREPLETISKEDLVDASSTLESLINVGFKIDFLKKKIKEMVDKKEKEQDCKKRMREIEEELNVSKKKCSDLEILLEKEKKVLVLAMAPLPFDDAF